MLVGLGKYAIYGNPTPRHYYVCNADYLEPGSNNLVEAGSRPTAIGLRGSFLSQNRSYINALDPQRTYVHLRALIILGSRLSVDASM